MSDIHSATTEMPTGTSIGDVVMFYQGEAPHSAHGPFADAVNADLRHFETGRTPYRNQSSKYQNSNTGLITDRIKTGSITFGYDIAIAEGSAPLHTLLVHKTLYPSTTAIYLAADEYFKTLPNRVAHPLWSAGVGKVANRLLDGVIAVGKDAATWAAQYLGDVPIKICHPPISDKKYDQLADLRPQSPQNPFTIISVGEARKTKRFDRVVDAAQQLQDRIDAKVITILLGDGHQVQPYAETNGVKTPGFLPIDEFIKQYEEASVYVQASDGDAFPVATLEAMLTGTPTVVTKGVGTRRLLPDENVVKPTATALVERLEALYVQETTERQAYGESLQTMVEDLTETTQQRRFRTAVREMTNT